LDERTVVSVAVVSVLQQHLSLFEKAKIGDTKKLKSLQKQIKNYVSGHIKKYNVSQSPAAVFKAKVIADNEELICTNLLKILWQKKTIRIAKH